MHLQRAASAAAASAKAYITKSQLLWRVRCALSLTAVYSINSIMRCHICAHAAAVPLVAALLLLQLLLLSATAAVAATVAAATAAAPFAALELRVRRNRCCQTALLQA
jgi:hypothetical protein